jgi:glycosyltransferase involved in cell wall biosynthesis
MAERISTILPNEMVTDAQVIQDYYLARHNAPSTMIAYGSEVERRPDREMVRKWRVEPNRYVLYVSRLEPENNAHLVIEAFKKVRTAYRLLIVGDAPYAEHYINSLRASARGDKRIIFTGFVFGQDYRALQQNAYCYVHATEVGGTHPALLEAMGYGNCVLTLATPENIEVVGDAGVPYADEYDLAAGVARRLAGPVVPPSRAGPHPHPLRLGPSRRSVRTALCADVRQTGIHWARVAKCRGFRNAARHRERLKPQKISNIKRGAPPVL